MTQASTANREIISDQQWQMVGDEHSSPLIRNGANFAARLEQMGCYVNATAVLAVSKVGDCIKTGVSAYERVK